MTDTCKTCRHWAPMLRDRFLGICAVSKQCTDRVDSCEWHRSTEVENVVGRGKIEGFLE